jgi:integrase
MNTPADSLHHAFENAELEKILRAAIASHPLVTIILLCAYARLRVTDAVRVRRSMFDLDNGYADFSQLKKGAMPIPLHPILLNWLRSEAHASLPPVARPKTN